MKKTIIKLTAISSLLVTSCISEDIKFNDDTKKAYDVSAESLLSNSQKGISDQLTSPSVNENVFRYFSQYWAATLYTAESRYNLINRNIPGFHWNNLYRDVLGNLQSAEEVIQNEIRPDRISATDWAKIQTNKKAIIEILKIYTYQNLVDTFGNIPYSESLKNQTNILPKYDDAATIYSDLIVRLNNAISKLDLHSESFKSGDLIYAGNVEKWLKFANSLKVKLGINLSDFNPALSKQTVETAVAGGIITSNTDNALFRYSTSAPTYNPIFDNLVASNRNDFVPAKTIVDYMNSLSDPRRGIFFTKLEGAYTGGVYGAQNANPYATSYSHVGDAIKKSDAFGVLVDASEINFLLAEAAERGYSVGNNAQYYYNTAITSSMNYWNIPSNDINNYLAQPNINYTTASGNWKEKIGMQAWIAMYNRGFESWTFYRRLDYPILKAPTKAVAAADKKVPVRYTYPISESTINGSNYTAAAEAIGGDKLYTKIFWDKN
ncbi:SusD/RagB family nutrient-binding outer membrane lipoprotein [Flavobacterium davisii]|uniref:SusD/RagB family nutrient-binding outer membrane lipoprotein n=1 Tax=Flavobacterium columnare TaxID=996 RepID=A0A8G0P5Z5_9FLAO|nr:SusD/RagB family nutrient-binding outer membrane lipoprotein [Flavobacterium davisii]QYS89536.1 SusD/RagB family nutrient-binding outer membrane lipoprotein [Flavobacterium davisii]